MTITTLNEAGSKLCPVKHGVVSGKMVSVVCAADQCMAWRWAADEPNNLGYCGMAGKPLGVVLGEAMEILPKISAAVRGGAA